jgi:cystathionine gamma-synthase
MTAGAGDGLGFETRAIHAGQDPDPTTGAVVPPIVLSSTYAQSAVGVHQGYEYSRSGNPTRTALEQCVASLEAAAHGLAFASGLAAEDAVLRLLDPGGHVVMSPDAYGGTFRLLSKVHTALSWSIERQPAQMVWVETPTNPRLRVVDIAEAADFAHSVGALLVVDNTFATPYLQQPLALGADIVVHSSTKYLGGHSDVVGGFIAVDDDGLFERLAFLQNAVGGVPGPLDCYLVLRGVKTLALRMDRHCANAAALAAMLRAHPAVDEVFYPDCSEVAARQMRGFGGMVSFTLRGGEAEALRVAGATRVFTLAESLGAVESLIEHPAAMTHASVAGSPLAVDPALVRLSVGVETVEDLLADLEQALG